MDTAKRRGDEPVNAKKDGAASPDKSAAGSQAIPTPTYFAFWSVGAATSHPILSHSMICAILMFLSATGTLPLFQSIVQPFISALALLLFRITFIVTSVLAFLHRTGALRRYAIQFAETELSKNMNGTLITATDAQIDLWRGRVIAYDLIIHNKERDDWEWESPCLARVGRIEATMNFASVIQLPWIGRILNHTFFDIYTLLVEDVQVFVEKRKNVFNFHLLDASLDIPDSKLIMEEHAKMKMKKKKQELGSSSIELSKSSSLDKEEERGDLVGNREEESATREKEDEANKIVESLVGAVSKIGKAAGEGGSKGLQSALRIQKDGLVYNLKQLHTQKSTSSKKVTERQDSTSWREKKERGVSVMREFSKVVEKNVSDIKNQVAFLQKPPGKKPGWVPGSPDYIRVGSILFREARIFTKDILTTKSNKGNDEVNEISAAVGSKTGIANGWAKPIVIFELALTGAELCPPMSSRDPTSGMAVVGITIDRLVDIILKRVMAEAAKSNTGRLFQTAFGDVFSFVGDNVSRSERSGDE
ncbi:hypothetical protein ACHAWF_016310 [Thalassiosira exigua]